MRRIVRCNNYIRIFPLMHIHRMSVLTRPKKFLITLLFILPFVAKAQTADSLKTGTVLIVTDTLKTVDSVAPVYQKINDRANKITAVFYKGDTFSFPSPKPFGFVKNVPSDLLYIAKSPFQKKNLVGLAAVVASTAVLIVYDQQITDWIKKTSNSLGIDPETDYLNAVHIGKARLVKLPNNLTTAFYQAGLGGTSLLLAGGIWGVGKLTHDYRAISTANDLFETFISMGVTTQVLKRITGRESPFMATVSGGKWRPFPSFAAYQKETPMYDAFPSGHLATLMATITVLAANYPEKKWIKPVGYSVMGLSAWTMANIEVHWVGDYPLALAVGYLAGKITTMRHQKKAVRHLSYL